MLNKFNLAFACLFCVVISTSVHAQVTNRRPNIIFLLVDDLGWKDVGFMGSKFYETPNLDSLASEGMVFTNAYAACALCSPTRASIITGRYPARIGVTDWIRARFQKGKLEAPEPYAENAGRKLRTPSNPYWMDLDEVTIAEVLKESGYLTAHIGKWHLGPDAYYPKQQGYDINIAGSDMGQPVNYFDPYERNGIKFPTLEPRKEGEYLEDRLSDELLSVIRSHTDKPFFISMNFYAVHTPLMAKKDIIEKYNAKMNAYDAKLIIDHQKNPLYAAMIESVDQSVGKLILTLRKTNLLENTVIIFFSDNGGMLPATSNIPLRAGKGYPYEGGIREPMFVYWKGQIKPGSISDVPVSSVDFFPTISALTDSPPPEREIDGRDISPLFSGGTIASVPLFWHYPHYRGAGGDMPLGPVVPYSMIRDGDWKLILRYEGKKFELFNLKSDIGETTDVSEKFPEVVEDLNRKLGAWLKNTNAKIPIPKRKANLH